MNIPPVRLEQETCWAEGGIEPKWGAGPGRVCSEMKGNILNNQLRGSTSHLLHCSPQELPFVTSSRQSSESRSSPPKQAVTQGFVRKNVLRISEFHQFGFPLNWSAKLSWGIRRVNDAARHAAMLWHIFDLRAKGLKN
jgi:hypothetical protein